MISEDSDLAQLLLLEPDDSAGQSVAALGGEVLRVGPFRICLHPDAGMLGFPVINPVYPLPDESSVVAGIRELRPLLARLGKSPELEFNSQLFHTLPALLEANGFILAEHEPLMILDSARFTPGSNPAVHVRFLGPDDPDAELAAFQRIFTEVLLAKPYGQGAEEIGRLRREIERAGGESHALAKLRGAPAGTGFITREQRVAEITRVATLPEVQRQGVAATLTSFMLRDRFRRGAQVAWLTASGEPAQALYERLGFRVVGERLYFKPAPA